jgi:tRNA-guanine family transglycosylase
MAQRTAVWMDECLKARAEARIPANTLLFGPVVGGSSERERTSSAQEAARRPALDGYAILGLGCGEALNARELHVQTCLEHLDPAKPRFVSGLGAPEEVLWSAARGMDLIESTYPFVAATQGLALTFKVAYDDLMGRGGDRVAEGAGGGAAEGAAGDATEVRGGKLNLWDTCHARDIRPVAPV